MSTTAIASCFLLVGHLWSNQADVNSDLAKSRSPHWSRIWIIYQLRCCLLDGTGRVGWCKGKSLLALSYYNRLLRSVFTVLQSWHIQVTPLHLEFQSHLSIIMLYPLLLNVDFCIKTSQRRFDQSTLNWKFLTTSTSFALETTNAIFSKAAILMLWQLLSSENGVFL